MFGFIGRGNLILICGNLRGSVFICVKKRGISFSERFPLLPGYLLVVGAGEVFSLAPLFINRYTGFN